MLKFVRNYAIIIVLIFNCYTLHCSIIPQLPNTDAVITCFPDTTGYKVVTVGPSDRDFSDLQQAINSADLGTIIKLDAGAVFTGSYILPKKESGDGWIILMSSRMDLLSEDETRIDPDAATGHKQFVLQADAMPKIITINLSGVPCFRTQAEAHHYRFVGLEITADQAVTNSYGLVNLGDASSAQSSMSQVPHHFVIDRCYIHGHTAGEIMKYGVALNCANAAIIDSHISDFHSIGFDAQAIAGVNGPGPFKIINNYLEASGENIMFGGGAAGIPGLVPSDIEIRQNHLFKPLTWRVGDPSYAGKHWTIKNLFELKTGMRVLFDGNILENSWADLPIGQSGYAILLTIRTENGGSPQAEVSDITISNNIIRRVGAGITLSGLDDGGKGIRSKRVMVYNNLFEDINGSAFGDLNINGPNDGTFLKIGEPVDVIVDHNTILQTGPITWAIKPMSGFVYTNNISFARAQSAGYQGIYGPGFQHGNKTIANFFPDITDDNKRFSKNILIGGDESKYTNYNNISKNYFPSANADVGFININNGQNDYHNYGLSTESIYKSESTDGKNIGVDFSIMDSAINYNRGCLENQIINVISIVVAQDSVVLAEGGNINLTVEVNPANATNKKISWKSSNSAISKVDATGFVTAIKEGMTEIIATSEDGNFADTCFVTVMISNSVFDESSRKFITITPNPASEFITISFPFINPTVNRRVEETVDVKIFNTLGECVMTVETRHAVSLQRIDISHLPRGMYYICIGNRTQMFVKM